MKIQKINTAKIRFRTIAVSNSGYVFSTAGGCDGFVCGNMAEYCIESASGEATCECPACTNVGVDEVCGYIQDALGDVHQGTWQSACHLRKFACENDVPLFEVVHEGPCGGTRGGTY